MKIDKVEKNEITLTLSRTELALLLGSLDHLTDDPTISDKDFITVFNFTRPNAEKLSDQFWGDLKKAGVFE